MPGDARRAPGPARSRPFAEPAQPPLPPGSPRGALGSTTHAGGCSTRPRARPIPPVCRASPATVAARLAALLRPRHAQAGHRPAAAGTHHPEGRRPTRPPPTTRRPWQRCCDLGMPKRGIVQPPPVLTTLRGADQPARRRDHATSTGPATSQRTGVAPDRAPPMGVCAVSPELSGLDRQDHATSTGPATSQRTGVAPDRAPPMGVCAVSPELDHDPMDVRFARCVRIIDNECAAKRRDQVNGGAMPAPGRSRSRSNGRKVREVRPDHRQRVRRQTARPGQRRRDDVADHRGGTARSIRQASWPARTSPARWPRATRPNRAPICGCRRSSRRYCPVDPAGILAGPNIAREVAEGYAAA